MQNNTLALHKITRRQQNNEILETKRKKANKEGEEQKAKQNMQQLWMTEFQVIVSYFVSYYHLFSLSYFQVAFFLFHLLSDILISIKY